MVSLLNCQFSKTKKRKRCKTMDNFIGLFSNLTFGIIDNKLDTSTILIKAY